MTAQSGMLVKDYLMQRERAAGEIKVSEWPETTVWRMRLEWLCAVKAAGRFTDG